MADSQRKTANLWSFGNVSIPVGERSKTFDISLPSNTYTVKAKYNSTNTGSVTIGIYDENEQIHTYNTTQIDGTVSCSYTGIITAIRLYAAGGYSPSASYSADFTEVMLNTGSTALPYEPYWKHSLRKLGTSTDTITTLPADLYADGQSATVGLVGNMAQTGVPTPQNPVQPSECGERTGNLLDRDTETKGVYVGTDGEEHSSSGWSASDYIPLDASTTYYISISTNAGNSPKHCFYDANKEFISYIASGSRGFTTPNNAAYGRFSYTVGSSQVMLNTGSTALPYQPYGYKIPISSANTTTPVYLGEVESTRRIKKLVLTGEESITKSGAISNCYYISVSDYLYKRALIAICTHYEVQANVNGAAEMIDKRLSFYANQGSLSHLMYIRDTSFATKEDLASYLAAQYAAGTPVTVWYVLAEPTTGIVNEPLRKIGDYADTVSGITIPTITGKDTFDVLTTLKPSEVSLAYTGWHDASAKEWDGSEWQ